MAAGPAIVRRADALALYRACLRAANKLPSYEHRVTWATYSRMKFSEDRRHTGAAAVSKLRSGWEVRSQYATYDFAYIKALT
jgi:Complex 1 protein (LYR family)